MAFRLPRLSIHNIPRDHPSFMVWWAAKFVPWWEEVVRAIEGQEAIQDSVLLSLVAALAEMPELAPVTITATYLGVVDPASQLPKYIQATRFQGGSDVTTTSVWSISSLMGVATATIGAATGLVEITAVTGNDTLTVTSVHQGIARTRTILVTFSAAAAPATGSSGSGTTATDTSFTSFSSTSMTTVSDTLTVTVGPLGKVQLTATSMALTTGVGTPEGQYHAYAIWQHDSTGAEVWVNLGSEVQSIYPCWVTGATGQNVYNGSVTCNHLHTGRTIGSSQKYRLNMRANATNPSASRLLSVSGTASAVGQ